MMVDAITFDIGSPSMRLSLFTAEGLAPLPIPFGQNSCAERFNALMNENNASEKDAALLKNVMVTAFDKPVRQLQNHTNSVGRADPSPPLRREVTPPYQVLQSPPVAEVREVKVETPIQERPVAEGRAGVPSPAAAGWGQPALPDSPENSIVKSHEPAVAASPENSIVKSHESAVAASHGNSIVKSHESAVAASHGNVVAVHGNPVKEAPSLDSVNIVHVVEPVNGTAVTEEKTGLTGFKEAAFDKPVRQLQNHTNSVGRADPSPPRRREVTPPYQVLQSPPVAEVREVKVETPVQERPVTEGRTGVPSPAAAGWGQPALPDSHEPAVAASHENSAATSHENAISASHGSAVATSPESAVAASHGDAVAVHGNPVKEAPSLDSVNVVHVVEPVKGTVVAEEKTGLTGFKEEAFDKPVRQLQNDTNSVGRADPSPPRRREVTPPYQILQSPPVAAEPIGKATPNRVRETVKSDVESAVPHAAPVVVTTAPSPSAASSQDQSIAAASAASARTEAIVESAGAAIEMVNQVVEAVVSKISVTPRLVQGEGEILITLKPTVLDGSEIRLAAKAGELTVSIAPATPESAQIALQNLPRLETALAAHASSFHHVAVVIATSKKGKAHEAA